MIERGEIVSPNYCREASPSRSLEVRMRPLRAPGSTTAAEFVSVEASMGVLALEVTCEKKKKKKKKRRRDKIQMLLAHLIFLQ